MIYLYRFIAFLIDLVISFTYYFILYTLYIISNQNPSPLLGSFIILASIFGPLILHTTIVALNNGQSIGKMVFGLQIVNAGNGKVPPVWKIALREIVKLVNMNTLIGLISLIVILQKPQNNQTVTDWGIGCRVIFKKALETNISNI